jgi:hypothetical protein
MLPPLPLTDPDVPISSIRIFTGELRSQQCIDGRSELLVEGVALEDLGTDPTGIGSPAATAISARSAQPCGRTSLVDESCPICRSRHSGPASSRPVGCAARGSVDAGLSGTTRSPMPARGLTPPLRLVQCAILPPMRGLATHPLDQVWPTPPPARYHPAKTQCGHGAMETNHPALAAGTRPHDKLRPTCFAFSDGSLPFGAWLVDEEHSSHIERTPWR